MSQFYNSLSKIDKRFVDCLEIWVLASSESKILNNREALERGYRDDYYIKTDEIYKDYLNIKEELEDHEAYSNELLLPLMEKLLGSSFDRFKTRYRKDKPNEEWFDDIDLLLDMDLEASGGVSIENITFFICTDKEFDEKVIRLSKTRFEAIGKVFKKKYTIDQAREDRKKVQIIKDKIFRDRYDVYLVNHWTAKLSAYAINEQIYKSTINKFLSHRKEEVRDLLSYKDKIGEDRLNRILTLIKKDILKVLNSFNTHNKSAFKYGYQLISQEEMIHHIADYMNQQTKIYNNGNHIIKNIDFEFIRKAIHFKTLQKEHLRYHSNK